MPIIALGAEDLRRAALWLEANEGDDDERSPLLRVAQWLEHQADGKELRDAAREHGLPVGKLRAAMAKAT